MTSRVDDRDTGPGYERRAAVARRGPGLRSRVAVRGGIAVGIVSAAVAAVVAVTPVRYQSPGPPAGYKACPQPDAVPDRTSASAVPAAWGSGVPRATAPSPSSGF